jgi:hypothetical protein
MRSPYICLIVLAFAVLLVMQPVAALTVMQVPYVRAGPVWSLGTAEIADLFILETNTSHLAASDNEAFAISFAPAPGSFTIAPAIAQTSGRTIACDQSYFYRDFSEAV